jgi:uroporphyrinogen-III synthase
MTRCVLVVRPQPAADLLVERLRADGIDALASPVSEYIELPFDLPDLSAYSALAFTSAEAVRVSEKHFIQKNLPVFCVGEATAEAARTAEFSNVHAAKSDACALAALIAQHKNYKKILHLSGADIAEDIAPMLVEKNMILDRIPVYAARLLDELPPEAVAALDEGRVRAVLLFSARAAARFVSLMPEGAAAGIEAIALSPRVATGASGAAWKRVRIASSPTVQAMIDIL